MQRRLLSTCAATAAALALVTLALPTATLAQAPDWKTIRIGVEGAYPPFSEVGPDGKIKGFDIDMANALCAQMKAQCTLVAQEWDGMIPALQSRKFDAIIASMSATDERRKVVGFSDKYYNTPARLVAKAGAGLTASAEGLKGKRIGVQRSTIHDRFVTDTFKASEVVRYGKADEVYLDLVAGRIDVAMGDSVAIDGGLLRRPQGKGFAFFGPAYNDEKYFGTGSSIAVRKADAALSQRFSAAIKAIRADGTYKRIQDRYFDFDVYGDTK